MPLHIYKLLHSVFPDNKEVRELYVTSLLRTMGVSMIGIFLPLYLLSLGFSLSLVMVFYFLVSSTIVGSIFIATRFCAKYGTKKCILIAILVEILFYSVLFILPYAKLLVVVLAFLYGVGSAFYWIPFHNILAVGLDHKRLGKEYGVFRAALAFAAAGGPLIGGIMIAMLGFNAPFIAAILFLILSIIPLLLSKDFPMKQRFSLKKDMHRFDFRVLIGYLGDGIDDRITLTLWPIFIYMLVGSYITVGGLSALALVISTTSMMIAGWMFDTKHIRKMFVISTILSGIVGAARAFVSTVAHIVGIELLFRPANQLTQVTHTSAHYEAARKSGDVVAFNILRELFIHGGIAAFCLVFAFIFTFTQRVEIAFFVGAITHLTLLYTVKRKPLHFTAPKDI